MPVHGKVLVREQPGRARLGQHRVEERRADVARQQTIPILGKRRGMPNRVVHVQPDEPPEQEVVVQFFHQQPLAPDRVEHLQQQGPQQLFGRDRRAARLRIEPREASRQRPQRGVRQRPERAQGMISRHALFRREVAEHVIRLLVVSAQYVAPFLRSVGSMVVRRDRSVDPLSLTFSAAC